MSGQGPSEGEGGHDDLLPHGETAASHSQGTGSPSHEEQGAQWPLASAEALATADPNASEATADVW